MGWKKNIMNKKILVVHPTGNQNSRAVARGLANSGTLHTFITALNIKSDNFRWLPSKIYSELKRRDFMEINGEVKSGALFLESLRLIAAKLKIKSLITHESGLACVDNIYLSTDKYAAQYLEKHKDEIDAVYCYEDGALETFKTAKKLNIKCIYELPIGYWRTHHKLNKEESQLQPNWKDTWIATEDSQKKLEKKDLELSLADEIIVASSFTKKTLEDYPNTLASITVIPYGCPSPIKENDRKWFNGKEKLKVLYVGGLSQRKGLTYMLDALKNIKENISFSYIGLGNANDLIKESFQEANYLGTMSHGQVLNQMKKHDVLVFPSLFEGFGMVITEAMSQGMVVIATDHTALPDIANDDASMCVPIRDSKAIEDRLKKLIDNPILVETMGKKALELAKNYQWKDYEKNIVDLINEMREQ